MNLLSKEACITYAVIYVIALCIFTHKTIHSKNTNDEEA